MLFYLTSLLLSCSIKDAREFGDQNHLPLFPACSQTSIINMLSIPLVFIPWKLKFLSNLSYRSHLKDIVMSHAPENMVIIYDNEKKSYKFYEKQITCYENSIFTVFFLSKVQTLSIIVLSEATFDNVINVHMHALARTVGWREPGYIYISFWPNQMLVICYRRSKIKHWLTFLTVF